MTEYYIKTGSHSRSEPEVGADVPDFTQQIGHQSTVYPLAAHLARLYGCTFIIDIGCGQGRKLAELHPEFQLIGVDFGENITHCRKNYRFGKWVELNLDDENSHLELDTDIVSQSVIICSNVIEHLKYPDLLLNHLHGLLEHAPVGILSTPNRDMVYGSNDRGLPKNVHHIREWSLLELMQFAQACNLRVEFAGHTYNHSFHWKKATSLLILANHNRPKLQPAPDDFRVVAVMTVYNEADIIESVIQHLHEQGVAVYLIDNWSTDGTYEKAQALIGKGVLRTERFPETPPKTHVYSWSKLLTHVEEVAHNLTDYWVLHYDCDEIRESPFVGITLRDALYHVEQCGYNAIDHTVVNFSPIDNSFKPGNNLKDCITHFVMGKRPGYFIQIKGWKQLHQRVSLTASGGHRVEFPGRRVYPYKFLTRHYPLRSLEQASIKIESRQKQSNQHERSKGWHIIYDQINTENQHFFDRLTADTRATHERFDHETFYSDYLVERLTGIGIEREKSPLLQQILFSAYRYVSSILSRFKQLAKNKKF